MNSALPWLGIAGALVVAAIVAIAGAGASVVFAGIPVFALCVALAFLVQWLAFVPAYLKQTEHFYDLTGSLTYIGLALLALTACEELTVRSLAIGGLTIIWALRLGSFLTARLRSVGFDRRFRSIKPYFPTFLMTWTLQGLWVSLAFAPGLVAISSTKQVAPDVFLIVGAGLWLFGFVVEVVADEQKRQFRIDPNNNGKFITSGLWAWSQHPNYFGEIVLWSGVAVMAFPVLQGWQHLTLISPIFVWLLLMRVSGVRMLDASAKKRFGDDPAYQSYVAATPRLIPWWLRR